MNSDKALVEIYVPAAAKRFDVYIPLRSRMSEVIRLVSNALSDLSDGKYKATGESILCDADSGMIFNVNVEVWELGIKNGSRLMLI